MDWENNVSDKYLSSKNCNVLVVILLVGFCMMFLFWGVYWVKNVVDCGKVWFDVFSVLDVIFCCGILDLNCCCWFCFWGNCVLVIIGEVEFEVKYIKWV